MKIKFISFLILLFLGTVYMPNFSYNAQFVPLVTAQTYAQENLDVEVSSQNEEARKNNTQENRLGIIGFVFNNLKLIFVIGVISIILIILLL